jgi:hypothetical protein
MLLENQGEMVNRWAVFKLISNMFKDIANAHREPGRDGQQVSIFAYKLVSNIMWDVQYTLSQMHF